MNQPLPVSLSHSLNTKREWRPAADSPKDSLINSHTRTSLHTLMRFPLQMWEKRASVFCCGSMKLCYADISELSLRKSNLVVFNLCLNPSAQF